MTQRSADFRHSGKCVLFAIRRRKRSVTKSRRAIACVEFAVVVPVLVFCTLAIIDICNVIHLKQKVATVAFETARVASLPNSTFELAAQAGNEFAIARSLKSANVVVESHAPHVYPTRESLPLGFTLRAQVSVSIPENIPGPFVLFHGGRVTSPFVRISAR